MAPLYLVAICLLVGPIVARGATLIDSFDLGEQASVEFPGPIGNRRFVSLPSRGVPAEATITSTLDPSGGAIQFYVDTAGIPTRFPLDLTISYTGGGPDGTAPYSLLGYDAFVFSFADVLGSGSLIVELGSGSSSYGPEVSRIPISGSGNVLFPFDGIKHSSSGALDNFVHMHFVFEPDSQEFGFTLLEVNVIPEPSSSVLAALGIAIASIPRRRPTRQKA